MREEKKGGSKVNSYLLVRGPFSLGKGRKREILAPCKNALDVVRMSVEESVHVGLSYTRGEVRGGRSL